MRVIDVDPTSTRAAFEIRSCVSRGEFVAILGDRAQLGGRTSRVSYSSFLGRPAAFSQGPFLISMALKLPVILTVALKTGPRTYDVFSRGPGRRQPGPRARIGARYSKKESISLPRCWKNIV